MTEVGGSTINFLDLKFLIVNKRHKFDKKYNIVILLLLLSPICGTSFHAVSRKYSAYFAMIHTLISLPLDESCFQIERNTIKYVAHENNIRIDVEEVKHQKSNCSNKWGRTS